MEPGRKNFPSPATCPLLAKLNVAETPDGRALCTSTTVNAAREMAASQAADRSSYCMKQVERRDGFS